LLLILSLPKHRRENTMLFDEAVPTKGEGIHPAAKQKKETHKGQAHFAGTGPKGATCRTCAFWAFEQNMPQYKADGTLHMQRCNKFQQMMRRQGNKIPHEASACRYHEEAQKDRPRQNPDKN